MKKNKNENHTKPGRYVVYNTDNECVRMSNILCAGQKTNSDKFVAIWEWIIGNMSYNHIRAITVKAGYVPNLDFILSTKNGICLDIAALMVAMLRVQGIPSKLIFGDAVVGFTTTYHAWVSANIDGKWIQKDPTFAITGAKCKSYKKLFEY